MNASRYLEDGLGIKINQNFADLIDTEASFTKFSAKQIVLLEGSKAENLYFILDGIVRGYYIDEQGNDITKCFCSETDFFCSEGLRTGKASSYTIECLIACKCIKLPYKLIHKILNEDESLKNLFLDYNIQEISKLEDRAKYLTLMDAEERYINFCKLHPHIHDRIELKYIASYIGIRAASLSRIRKEIKNSSLN